MYNNEIIDDEEERLKIITKAKRNKIVTIVIIVTLILLIIATIMLSTFKREQHDYIVLGDGAIVEYNDGSYKQLKSQEFNFNKQLLRLFYKQDFIGSYYLSRITDGGVLYFSNDRTDDEYSFKNNYIAISRNMEHINYKTTIMNYDDFDVMKESFEKDFVKKLSDLSSWQKVNMDFDSDGITETLYFVTYEEIKENSEELGDKSFSLVYYSKNGIIYPLRNVGLESSKDGKFLESYNIKGVIDVNDDGRYELIIEKYTYEVPNYLIFELNDSNYYQLKLTTTI